MVEGQVYDRIGLLEEAQRYKTSVGKLEILYNELAGSKRLLVVGLGARLFTIASALTEELYGVDINPGSIERAEEFAATWKKYKNKEPFKAEFDFLQQKQLKPKFENHKLFLWKTFPSNLSNSFDGILASELFLHLETEEIKELLEKALKLLKSKGKFIFTAYTSGSPDSFDEQFLKLGSKIRMNESEFIQNRTVNIQKLAKNLKAKSPRVFEENKEKYWLDLEKARFFSTEEIERICKGVGFKVKLKENYNGGMFSFAHRMVYVLIKED